MSINVVYVMMIKQTKRKNGGYNQIYRMFNIRPDDPYLYYLADFQINTASWAGLKTTIKNQFGHMFNEHVHIIEVDTQPMSYVKPIRL